MYADPIHTWKISSLNLRSTISTPSLASIGLLPHAPSSSSTPTHSHPTPAQRDKFARQGEVLLAAALCVDPLERCLAVVRHVLVLLADVLRPGG